MPWLKGQQAVETGQTQFGKKRYIECVALLGQAWEIFFSLFASSNYLYRPYLASRERAHSVEDFNRLSSQLAKATRRCSFYPLRNLLINTVLKGVHPQTLRESEAAISRIVDENLGNNPTQEDVERFPDRDVRDLLKQLQQLTIADLRNAAVHQHAYRPRRAEAEKCLQEKIELLYRAKNLRHIYTYDEWPVRGRQRQKG